jgi:leucine-zipper of insertion element IS481
MASLCREFGISRKTGYKILEQYEECGLEGLTDRARRPHRYANQLPEQIEAAIVTANRVGAPAPIYCNSRPSSMPSWKSSTTNGRHEALDMKCPAEVYTASTPPYRGLGEPALPVPRQRSISALAWLVRPSVSRKSTMASGSLASCNTTSAMSTWKRKHCNPSTTLSDRNRNPAGNSVTDHSPIH